MGLPSGRSGPAPPPVTAADRLVRAEHLRDLARRVAEGRYRIPAEQVADAILDFYRREA